MTFAPLQRSGFRPAPRKPVVVGDSSLVAFEPLAGGGARPAKVRPLIPSLSLEEWAAADRSELRAALLRCGALLLRGFNRVDTEGLERFVGATFGGLLEYDNRSTPRTRVTGRVFTSTEYPADQSIPQHNEMSYADAWPRHLCFACLVAAPSGGETPISDSARVLARIPAPVRERFERDGIMYVRNFGHGLDLSWQEAFQQDEPGAVDDYCRAHGIQTEWLADGKLRTRQISQATTLHPETGTRVWFNQAHLFHVSSLPGEVRSELERQFAPEDLPRHAFFGDGSPIGDAELETVRAAYAEEKIAFPWEAGDVLLIDNIQMGHGRRPYDGPRKVVVAMS